MVSPKIIPSPPWGRGKGEGVVPLHRRVEQSRTTMCRFTDPLTPALSPKRERGNVEDLAGW
jgi:hypothetical protein